MRFIPCLLLLLVLTLPALPGPYQPAPSPDQLAQLCVQYLTTDVPVEQWPYVRFFSWVAVPRDQLSDRKRVFNWWLHQLSFRPGVSLPQEVLPANGWLTMVDIRDYGWNGTAWRAVSEREPFTHEPLIESNTAKFLREAAGNPITKGTLAKDRLPIQMMVRADWFFRETIETLRSTSYYDMLFANRRYPKSSYWKGGEGYAVGWYFEPPFQDFPKDEREWDSAFGIDLTKQFTKANYFDLDFGAIVEGGLDNPKGGSIVAAQNRLIAIINVPTGWAGKTADTKETSGLRDYTQSLIFGGKPFKPGEGAVAQRDGGEFLASLPNGGQAGFVVNAQGKRLEVAPPEVANDTSDPRMNPGVRTNGSCASCHSEHYGLIPPRNLFEEMAKAGVEVKFKGREQYNRTLAFFLGWEKRVAPLQAPYADLIRRTAGNWAGPELAKQFRAFWHWYDSPVTLGQAAAELGYSVDLVRRAAAQSPNARLNMLERGLHIPRRTWDVDVYRELMLLMAAARKP